MASRFFIKTFGCQMNEYDSAKMADVLADTQGATAASSAEQADILLLNTCSIREKAQDKVFSQLGRWRSYKSERPRTIIGVGGCVASQEGDAIIRRAPYVDLVFGPQTLHRLPEMIASVRAGRRGVVDVSFPEIEKFDHLPERSGSGCTAFLSVMEGCSKYCSFCVVPYTRGEEISRPLDDVVAEVVSPCRAAACRKSIILGQNVNSYRGVTHDSKLGRSRDADSLHCSSIDQVSNALRFHDLAPDRFRRCASIDRIRGRSPKLAAIIFTCLCRAVRISILAPDEASGIP